MVFNEKEDIVRYVLYWKLVPLGLSFSVWGDDNVAEPAKAEIWSLYDIDDLPQSTIGAYIIVDGQGQIK